MFLAWNWVAPSMMKRPLQRIPSPKKFFLPTGPLVFNLLYPNSRKSAKSAVNKSPVFSGEEPCTLMNFMYRTANCADLR
jgi:hypothetical protein